MGIQTPPPFVLRHTNSTKGKIKKFENLHAASAAVDLQVKSSLQLARSRRQELALQ